jgi:UDP-N-acetyl-D-glucosamine dehydrogenase
MKKIVVIGQGFVGFPMSIALSSIKNNLKKNIFSVTGLEKNDIYGQALVDKINNKKIPLSTDDKKLKNYFRKFLNKNYFATCNTNVIASSDIVIVSISFNFDNKKDLKNLFTLTRVISSKIKKNSLLLFETTLPPGMCQKKLYPIIKNNLKKRNLKINDIAFAYSYERVTPGKNYFNSVVKLPRSYSGINKKSKRMCKNFLLKLLQYKKLLYEHDTITDCEAAKILENSYRATNIALIDEWVKFSTYAKINLSKIIESIKIRPTHNNLMSQGLGVGGYCLTKDPGFLPYSSKYIFNLKKNYPIIDLATKINHNMIYSSIDFIKKISGGFAGKKILILGFTYKEDIADFRNSPTIRFAKKIISDGGIVTLYDPYSDCYKNNENFNIQSKYSLNEFDIVTICVNHNNFKNKYLNKMSLKPYYFDLNNIYTQLEIKKFRLKKIKFFQLGNR